MTGRDSPPDPRPVPRRHPLAHDLPGQGYGAERPRLTPPRDLIALRRAKRGDTAAFAGLLRDNDASIRAFVAALIGPEPMDQVMLDAYVKAYRGLPLAPTTSPRIWLLGIADGACRDAIRRRNRPSHRTGRIEDPPIPLGLSQDQRLALALIDASGLTTREATRLTQVDVAETRDLLATARERLDPAVALSRNEGSDRCVVVSQQSSERCGVAALRSPECDQVAPPKGLLDMPDASPVASFRGEPFRRSD